MSEQELLAKGPREFWTLSGTLVLKLHTGYENPFGPTGLRGPGVLGCGLDANGRPIPENRAIDIVIQFIDPKEERLKFLGGVRGDTGQPCFVGGFQEEDALATAVREFIEEAISGSIDLKHYAPRLYDLCKVIRYGEYLSDAEKEYLKAFHINPEKFTGDIGEATYHFIAKEDPVFVTELKSSFSKTLSIAYQGPCLADPRNTDDRWMATTLLTGIIDKVEIDALLAKQKYPYRFVGGSDLAEVGQHDFGEKFILNAFASHGALICYAVAHALKNTKAVPKAILNQCLQAIFCMKKEMGEVRPLKEVTRIAPRDTVLAFTHWLEFPSP